jgi:hypothetical protein
MSLISLDFGSRDGTVLGMAKARADGAAGIGEKAWVQTLVPRLEEALSSAAEAEGRITVGDGVKLPYTSEVQGYDPDGKADVRSSAYETDLLISDVTDQGRWVPRVVVECKLGGVTTHDALTYSAKASTHKHVHPYLRYGFLAGRLPGVPARLVKHGTYFDFMAAWSGTQPSKAEWEGFITLLIAEVRASRALQRLLANSRVAATPKYHLLHRPLLLS